MKTNTYFMLMILTALAFSVSVFATVPSVGQSEEKKLGIDPINGSCGKT